MAKRTKAQIYADALINIMFHHGRCWDGKRECHDPQAVARNAIKKADPALHKRLEDVKYPQVSVRKNGSVKIHKIKALP
jgi:hypothetical protein